MIRRTIDGAAIVAMPGLGNDLLTPHPLYLSLGADGKERQSVYRALFRPQLDGDAIDDIRLALNQSQPLGNECFYQHIQQMTGQRREGKPRGRPRKPSEGEGITSEQGELEL